MVLIRSFWSYGQKILRYGVIIFWPSPNESPLNIRVSSSPVSLRLRPHSSVLRWSRSLDFKVSSLCWIGLFFFFFSSSGMGAGFREETLKPNEGHQGPEARPSTSPSDKVEIVSPELPRYLFSPSVLFRSTSFPFLKCHLLGSLFSFLFFVFTDPGTTQWLNHCFL